MMHQEKAERGRQCAFCGRPADPKAEPERVKGEMSAGFWQAFWHAFDWRGFWREARSR